MKSKRAKEGEPPPLAPKVKRQARRRDRHIRKRDLKMFIEVQLREREEE